MPRLILGILKKRNIVSYQIRDQAVGEKSETNRLQTEHYEVTPQYLDKGTKQGSIIIYFQGINRLPRCGYLST